MTDQLLSIQNVTQRFGGLKVFDDITLSVHTGEIVSLIGPNGAGKTTLFNIVSGLLEPTAGAVTFDGHDLTRMPAFKRARLGIARTFQHPRPFEQLSVYENVMVGAFQNDLNIEDVRAQATTWLERVHVDPSPSTKLGRLTLLQRKFVEVARAMASQPRLLLLDEVMTGLTPGELDEVMTLIQEIREEGTTVLLIEHVMSAVMKLSDRVVVLANGSIIADGKPEAIATDLHVISAYLGESYVPSQQ